jgi:hypothetical protein
MKRSIAGFPGSFLAVFLAVFWQLSGSYCNQEIENCQKITTNNLAPCCTILFISNL